MYISEALALAKKCIGQRMVFKVTGEDYEDSSLERLIEVFKKLSDNSQLVADLRRFKDERNFLSHKGIAHCLDYEGDIFFSTAAEYEARLAAIQVEAERLRHALHQEGSHVCVKLDFGFLPDATDPGNSAA